jgi:PKD repeat protein
VGDTVRFNAQPSTAAPGRTIASYEWDFGDGSIASGITAEHAFDQARTYDVVLRVTDDLGQRSVATQTVTVKDLAVTFTASPASATILPPATTATIAFNALGSRVGAGATIVTYTWDFGDGSISSTAGSMASHAFAAGTYTVVLTIEDSRGHTGTASETVTVQ